ncbi:hypothetical protein EYF80_012205 [Liparis tanakae]|uniref:Uncharacterized protein n=1 Tax=Liparis tanakae TaxID=230148 RepID=A0A4Z2IIQ2_9TELE|nr:hypothetical protein EYF80_012205 [Liparis tanakae]
MERQETASSDHCTTAVPGLSRQGSGLIMHVCNNNNNNNTPTTTKAAANPALSDPALWKISREYVFTSEQGRSSRHCSLSLAEDALRETPKQLHACRCSAPKRAALALLAEHFTPLTVP